jgi:large subunit ribosomal protein L28
MLKFLPMKKAKISKLIRKHSTVSHTGHNVSHAKNRTKRKFKYNLHAVTVVLDGVKKKIKVPTSQLRQLKKAGLTTHYRKPTETE